MNIEGIGDINENDIKIVQSDPNIIIVNFNTKIDTKAQGVIERSNIQVNSFDIIYNLITFLKEIVISKIPKEYIDQVSGTAKIMAIFNKNKDKQILGGKVQEGSLTVGSDIKILRRDAEIEEATLEYTAQISVKYERAMNLAV